MRSYSYLLGITIKIDEVVLEFTKECLLRVLTDSSIEFQIFGP